MYPNIPASARMFYLLSWMLWLFLLLCIVDDSPYEVSPYVSFVEPSTLTTPVSPHFSASMDYGLQFQTFGHMDYGKNTLHSSARMTNRFNKTTKKIFPMVISLQWSLIKLIIYQIAQVTFDLIVTFKELSLNLEVMSDLISSKEVWISCEGSVSSLSWWKE